VASQEHRATPATRGQENGAAAGVGSNQRSGKPRQPARRAAVRASIALMCHVAHDTLLPPLLHWHATTASMASGSEWTGDLDATRARRWRTRGAARHERSTKRRVQGPGRGTSGGAHPDERPREAIPQRARQRQRQWGVGLRAREPRKSGLNTGRKRAGRRGCTVGAQPRLALPSARRGSFHVAMLVLSEPFPQVGEEQARNRTKEADPWRQPKVSGVGEKNRLADRIGTVSRVAMGVLTQTQGNSRWQRIGSTGGVVGPTGWWGVRPGTEHRASLSGGAPTAA